MMNKKEIFRKVGGILTELNEQYDYLSKSPENLNELEMELFAANANFLSDHISVLVKLNTPKQQNNINSISEEAEQTSQTANLEDDTNSEDAEEQGVVEEESEIAASVDIEESQDSSDKEADSSEIRFEFGEVESSDESAEAESVSAEPSIATEQGEDIPEEPVSEVVEAEANHQPELEMHVKEVVLSERTVAISAEQTNPDHKPTLNEMLSKKAPQENMANQFNQRQAKDLKSMVSLNDKLLFVRDLFNGYNLAYSEAIELLNRFDSFEAAQNFLKTNYAVKNNWSDKQSTADKFYEVLERRFIR